MEYLRAAVEVDPGEHAVGLRFGFWSLELPRQWVANTAGMDAFLDHRSPLSTVDLRTPEASNLAGVLRIAGCLTAASQDSYRLCDVLRLFLPLCVSWHARYYAHPLWQRIRGGRASRNALVAWVLHNYHLSQSAGITAARCAVRAPRPDVRRLFLDSAVEEYSHCRDYYAVNDVRIGIVAGDARTCVPLSANVGFDQQMLRIAEEDWLAHILVGYFQESTASYYTQCAAFYDEVEARYGLPGFFDGWKGHMRLDLDYGHASAFGDALASEEQVTGAQLRASFQNTAVTVQWLMAALDQILDADRDGDRLVLRRPLADAGDWWTDNALLGRARANPGAWTPASVRDAGDLYRMSKRAGLVGHSQPASFLSPARARFLDSELAEACCRALSSARSEGQLLTLGRLVELSLAPLRARLTADAWCAPDAAAAGVSNFIRESALSPAEFAICALHAGDRLSLSAGEVCWLQREDARVTVGQLAAACPVSQGEAASLATRLVQFDELWREPDPRSLRLIDVDVLR